MSVHSLSQVPHEQADTNASPHSPSEYLFLFLASYLLDNYISKEDSPAVISGLFRGFLHSALEEESWKPKWTKHEHIQLFTEFPFLRWGINTPHKHAADSSAMNHTQSCVWEPFAAVSDGFAQHSAKSHWSSIPQTTQQVSVSVQLVYFLCAFLPLESCCWESLFDLPSFSLVFHSEFIILPLPHPGRSHTVPLFRTACLIPVGVFNLLQSYSSILFYKRFPIGHTSLPEPLIWVP